jgi:hypothetical protein
MVILTNLLVFIHTLIVFFLSWGFLLPKKYLIYHLFAWPIVWLHWQLNNQRCILTEWEFKLRGIDDAQIIKVTENDSPFMRKLYKMIFGDKKSISNETLHYSIIILFTLAWIISLIRIF